VLTRSLLVLQPAARTIRDLYHTPHTHYYDPPWPCLCLDFIARMPLGTVTPLTTDIVS